MIIPDANACWATCAMPGLKKPNLLVVGVGHSGTSAVTRMIGGLGWNMPCADDAFAEHVQVRECNTWAIKNGGLPDLAQQVVDDLFMHQPWVVKDPRFAVTLHLWQPLFAAAGELPSVLWLTREFQQVCESYRSRGELVAFGDDLVPGICWCEGESGVSVEELYASCARQVARWPGPVLHFEYERVTSATAVWSS